MKIILEKVSKQYNYEWIFRNIDFEFEAGKKYAILGGNGSGKSTLLKIIAGKLTPSKGLVKLSHNEQLIPPEQHYQHVSISAPYLELIEEFSLNEQLNFHLKFRKLIDGMSHRDFVKNLRLEKYAGKPLKYYSSGMKQRVKLGLAILSQANILLLDEPSTNLDQENTQWYRHLIDQYSEERIVAVCSNFQQEEYDFSEKELLLSSYK
ncbi:MAG: ABC transporter ATP-binding protein [Bacteroidales bacterium]|nr:ABC transporter ATP-binding protein [Bacteroidales bacterium]